MVPEWEENDRSYIGNNEAQFETREAEKEDDDRGRSRQKT